MVVGNIVGIFGEELETGKIVAMVVLGIHKVGEEMAVEPVVSFWRT